MVKKINKGDLQPVYLRLILQEAIFKLCSYKQSQVYAWLTVVECNESMTQHLQMPFIKII